MDPPAIVRFLARANRLISKVRVRRLDRARDTIDLVAAALDALLGVVRDAIFGEDFVDGLGVAAPGRSQRNVAKIASQ